MGRRGPAPTSAKVLAMRGSWRAKQRASTPEPEVAIPSVPPHLTKLARKEWGRVSKELAAIGILTAIDRAALSAYCVCWARWVEAEEHLKTEGEVIITTDGNQTYSPWWVISKKAMDQMKAFLTEFGMTPSSRPRLAIQPKEVKDPMDEFLKKR